MRPTLDVMPIHRRGAHYKERSSDRQVSLKYVATDGFAGKETPLFRVQWVC
jgi:hypothetical protein